MSEPTPDPDLVLVPAEAGDRHVRGPGVLDLGPSPLPGLVDAVEALGDDPVEARSLEPGEPVDGERAVLGGRGAVDAGHARLHARGQATAPIAVRALAQVLVVEREEVPGDVAGRRAPPPGAERATQPGGSGGGGRRSRAAGIRRSRSRRRSTARSGRAARSGASSSGKYRFSGRRSRLCTRSSSPSRKTRARKPSHLGSYAQPGPSGSDDWGFASIGSSGGGNGRRTRGLCATTRDARSAGPGQAGS